LNQKGIISNTTYLLVSKFIPALLLTLINVLFSRLLSHNDYGIYQSAWSIINICIIIVTFGIPRYVMSFGTVWQYSKKDLIVVIGIAFLFTLFPISYYLFVYANSISAFSSIIVILIIASQAFYMIQEANVISIIRNKLLLKVNLLYAVLLFLSHILILFVFEYTLLMCLVAILLVSLSRNLILFYIQLPYKAVYLLKQKIDKLELFWFGLNDSLQVLTKWFDKIILLFLISSSDYAVYFNGTYEIPLIGMALSAFQSVITSYGASAKSEEEQLMLFKKSTSFMACVLFPLFAFCFIYSNEIITLLFSSSYSESVQLFAITSLLLPMRIASYTVLLQLKKKGKVILLGSLLDFFVASALMMALYPTFGLVGLAGAMVIATYTQASFYTVFICKYYKCSILALFEIKRLLFYFIISIVSFLVLKFLFSSMVLWINFLGAVVLFFSLILFLLNRQLDLKQHFTRLF